VLAATGQKKATKGNTNKVKTNSTGNSTKKNTKITTKKGTTKGKKSSRKKNYPYKEECYNNAMIQEAIILTASAIAILFLLSNFGLCGKLGKILSNFMFGLFGITAYIFPILLFLGILFFISNIGVTKAKIKLSSAFVVYLAVCTILQQISLPYNKDTTLYACYSFSAGTHQGGGWIGALIGHIFVPVIGSIGMFILMTALILAGFVLITEKSLIGSVKKHGSRAVQTATKDVARLAEEKRVRQEEKKQNHYEENQQYQKRADKKIKGVASAAVATLGEEVSESLEPYDLETTEEITNQIPYEKQSVYSEDTEIQYENKRTDYEEDGILLNPLEPPAKIPEERRPQDVTVYQRLTTNTRVASDIPPEMVPFPVERVNYDYTMEETGYSKKTKRDNIDNFYFDQDNFQSEENGKKIEENISTNMPITEKAEEPPVLEYQFPPLALLSKGSHTTSDKKKALENQKVAEKLETTLHNFGVGVKVTNVTSGPTVTRYELLPEQGVKVSRIVGLVDDIKLSLAAADIRIEAPIPGKSAVGIEVPNKENATVMLRDLLESENFQNHKSRLAFAVGKDISGQTIVTDIAKMPHALIAGATGSGKSVCINTLIMSVLYKAHPDDVKLIMIDPKVVELSVYNGIPHLLIPVVTDPKQAAAALNWAVAEMTDRYNKFSEWNVRNIQGYNEKVETIGKIETDDKIQKMPQIVIIIDELADLMMVASGEVEEAICRLAQLARAAGIHLIIATQRPSVNVITGLIKANIPSRIAFAVSSGVDSRTILDTVGAEKLLGRGDMLFAPYGANSPMRIQGAFVSDQEVSNVVEFLKSQKGIAAESTQMTTKMMSVISVEKNREGEGNFGWDDYFIEAGRLILQSEKASIGMLQRKFKIGFNRAARIMDQLADAGLVGPEEGTKPRKILMSEEAFEQYIKESKRFG